MNKFINRLFEARGNATQKVGNISKRLNIVEVQHFLTSGFETNFDSGWLSWMKCKVDRNKKGFYNNYRISRALIGWFLSSIREQTHSDLHGLLYANELLVRVRLAFQKLYLFPVFAAEPLACGSWWRCYDAIYLRQEDRRINLSIFEWFPSLPADYTAWPKGVWDTGEKRERA